MAAWPGPGGRRAQGSGFSLSGSSSVSSDGAADRPVAPALGSEAPRRSPAPAHLLAVLVVVLADVAEVGREGLHGQRAGDLPAPPLDDRSCRDRRDPPLSLPCGPPFRAQSSPSCLLVKTDSRGGDGKKTLSTTSLKLQGS